MISDFMKNFATGFQSFKSLVADSLTGIRLGTATSGLLAPIGALEDEDVAHILSETHSFKNVWQTLPNWLHDTVKTVEPESRLLQDIAEIKQQGLNHLADLHLELHQRAPGWVDRADEASERLENHVNRSLVHLEMIGHEIGDRYWSESGANQQVLEDLGITRQASHASHSSDLGGMH